MKGPTRLGLLLTGCSWPVTFFGVKSAHRYYSDEECALIASLTAVGVAIFVKGIFWVIAGFRDQPEKGKMVDDVGGEGKTTDTPIPSKALPNEQQFEQKLQDSLQNKTKEINRNENVIDDEIASPLSVVKEPLKEKFIMEGTYHPWRRFFARLVDLNSIGLILYLGLIFTLTLFFPQHSSQIITKLENPFYGGVIYGLLWVPVEAVFLSLFGATPGKWLFGIKILSATQKENLSYPNAVQRASKVWIQGLGFGIPFVAVFTQFFAFTRLTSTGTTLWDTSAESIVTHQRWGPFRTIFCILSVLAVLCFISILTSLGEGR